MEYEVVIAVAFGLLIIGLAFRILFPKQPIE